MSTAVKPMTDDRLAAIRESTAGSRRFMERIGRERFIGVCHFVRHLEELLAEVDRLRTQPPGVARVRLSASWLEPKVGSLFRRGETEADGYAVDWVWLDDDFARGRGVNEISRDCYEIIEEG